jgi:hypothetical protein
MKKLVWIFILVLLGLSLALYSAVYKNGSIDGKHFDAELRQDGVDNVYHVDVVFKEKAANIYFKPGQVLPVSQGNNQYMTLYLKEEVITDMENVTLRQVKAPVVISGKDANPDNWETTALWLLKVKMNSGNS